MCKSGRCTTVRESSDLRPARFPAGLCRALRAHARPDLVQVNRARRDRQPSARIRARSTLNSSRQQLRIFIEEPRQIVPHPDFAVVCLRDQPSVAAPLNIFLHRLERQDRPSPHRAVCSSRESTTDRSISSAICAAAAVLVHQFVQPAFQLFAPLAFFEQFHLVSRLVLDLLQSAAYSSIALRTMVRTSACPAAWLRLSFVLPYSPLPLRLLPLEACVDLCRDLVFHFLPHIAQIFEGQPLQHLRFERR